MWPVTESASTEGERRKITKIVLKTGCAALEEGRVFELFQQFCILYGTRMFITVIFKCVPNCTLFQVRSSVHSVNLFVQEGFYASLHA